MGAGGGSADLSLGLGGGKVSSRIRDCRCLNSSRARKG